MNANNMSVILTSNNVFIALWFESKFLLKIYLSFRLHEINFSVD